MGLLSSLKTLAPIVIYVATFVLIVRALSGKAEGLLMLVIAILPLRNVVDKLHTMPLGKDFLDILFVVLLFSVLMKRVVAKNKLFTRSPLNPVVLMMLFYMFISLMIGSDYLNEYLIFDFSTPRIQSWKNFCMMPILFFITLNTVQDKKWIWRAVAVMCLTIALMDLYLIRQLAWYTSVESRTKVQGTFVYLGPNEVAAFFNQYTILLMGLYFFMKNGLKRMIVLGIICANTFIVLFLFSRGAYVALAVGMFFLFAIKDRKLLIPLLLLIVYWQVALPEKVRERILETTDAYGELDRSSELRLVVWQESLDLFIENPIAGIGYGVFSNLGLQLGDTHNIYLKILAEQGLVGIFIFLLLLFLFFVQGIRLFLGGDDDHAKGLGLGFAMAIIVLMVNNVFGDRWTYMEVSSYLWVFAALVSRLNIMANET